MCMCVSCFGTCSGTEAFLGDSEMVVSLTLWGSLGKLRSKMLEALNKHDHVDVHVTGAEVRHEAFLKHLPNVVVTLHGKETSKITMTKGESAADLMIQDLWLLPTLRLEGGVVGK